MDEFEVYLDFSLQAASFLEALISELDEAAQNEISPKSWVGGRKKGNGYEFRRYRNKSSRCEKISMPLRAYLT